MTASVTQFMRPNGRQVEHSLEISDDCKDKYQEIIGCGLRLTAEQLGNGTVSQTIEADDFDFDICLTKGSDLDENKKALEQMILRFDKKAFTEMQRGFEVKEKENE